MLEIKNVQKLLLKSKGGEKKEHELEQSKFTA